MNEQRVNEYIEGKYGKFGIDRYVVRVGGFCTEYIMFYCATKLL